MEILELPKKSPAGRSFDFEGLSDVLFESADLLEEARESDDADFRAAAIDLAVRSLYTASAAIDRYADRNGSHRRAESPEAAVGAVVAGPWFAAEV